MVDQPLAPGPAHGRVVEAGDQAGVLARDRGLIGIAVERPGLDLALAAAARVEPQVERVPVVIAPRADLAQAVDQFGWRQQAHSAISSPS